jgi:hypothetical protein
MQANERVLEKVIPKRNKESNGRLIILTAPTKERFDKNAKDLETVTAKDGSTYFLKHLTRDTIGTIVAEGIYERVVTGTYGGAATTEYLIRGNDDDLFKVNGCASLNSLFDELKGLEGDVWVRITFNGLNTNVKPGKKPFLDFDMHSGKV